MSVSRRVLLGVAAGALAALGAACTPDAAPPTEISLTVTQQGPPETETVEVPLGSAVTITVDSQSDDVLHVHGYEIETDLEAGGRELVQFDASMSGAYEIETHSNSAIWIKLVVR